VTSRLFRGRAGGSSDRWEETERVSREGEEVLERSREDHDWEKGESEAADWSRAE
jgi:hypothetical protein